MYNGLKTAQKRTFYVGVPMGKTTTKYYFYRDDSHSLEGESEPDFNTLSLHSPPRMDKERGDMTARSDISADSIERNNAGGPGSERFERAQARWLEDMRARGVKIVQVTYPRTANNDKELSVVRGELLEVSHPPYSGILF